MKWIIAWYLFASALTLAAYAIDKTAAQRRRRRIPEATLHLMELAGGFPGGLLGQRLLRHKSRKLRYRIVLGLIALAHVTGWMAWLLV